MDDFKHLQGLVDRDWVKRMADPMAEIRQQLQAAYLDPLREVRERTLDPYGIQAVAEQFKAATAMPSAIQDFLDQEQRHRAELADAMNWQARLEVEDFTKSLDWRSDWERMVGDITAPIRGFGIDTKAYLDAIGLGPGSDLVRLLEEWREHFDELPDQIRVQVALLIERGWCLDLEVPHVDLQRMVYAIEDGEEAEVQDALIDYFRDRLDAIEAALKQRHPQRAAVLEDAFQAHREGRYSLSVPVFLAQADGLTFDGVQRQLFSRKRSKGVTGFVECLPEDDMLTIYWSVFTIEADAPLTRDTHKLPPGFDGLNRHAVFHGTDPNYGTEVNSLRAVSVLNLASYLLTASEDEVA